MKENETIRSIFDQMNNKIRYCLLRDLEKDLFVDYNPDKDIDIIVDPSNKKEFFSLIHKEGWKWVRHPWDFGNNFIFLYGMDPFVFLTKNNVKLDVCFQLCCRSVNHVEWLPLDQEINKSVWENRYYDADKAVYRLAEKDELIHLVSRCIFDKMKFPEEYQMRISELFNNVDQDAFYADLELVLFRFAPECIKMIEKKEFDRIRETYISFSKY